MHYILHELTGLTHRWPMTVLVIIRKPEFASLLFPAYGFEVML